MKEIIMNKLRNILFKSFNLKIKIDNYKVINSIENLGLNSIDILNFIVKVEEEFNFQINDDDLDVELVIDLNKLCNYIIQHANL
jgi:acyl carrier protein